MRLLVRRLVLAALVCLVLLLSLGVALGLALQAVQRDPQALTQRLRALLPEGSGVSISLGTVGVRLLPTPRLVAGDVEVGGPGFRVSVAYVVATPSLTGILRGDALPAALTLYRPQITASLPVDSFVAGGGNGGPATALPPLPSFRVRMQQGQAVLFARDGSALSLVNARCNLRGHGSGIEGEAGCSSLTLYDAKARPLAGLINAALEGEAPLADWSERKTHIRLATQAALPPLLPVVRLALEVDGRPGEGTIAADVRGSLRVASALVPFGIAGHVERRADEPELLLRRWRLELAEDSARLDGAARLGENGGWPLLRGHLEAHRLSLTRWLDFARDLPPGLQWALDNITRGEADFELDGTGLRVSRVTARSSGSVFTGSGGVASWAAPVVALDLKSASVDLGLALPEAVGRAPEAPFYVHPPLTSAFDDPAAPPSSVQVGFDIRLGAERLRYGPLKLDNASVRITPGPQKEGRAEGARLTAEAAMYGGRLAAETLISSAGEENVYSITGSMRNADAAGVARDVSFFPIVAGRCGVEVSIESRGRGLDAFLRRLRGTLHADITHGRFRPGMDGGVRDFTRLALDATPRGGRALPEGAGAVRIEALWKARLEAPGLAADAQLDGPLVFGGRSRLRAENAALRGNLHMASAQGLTAGVAGQCSFDVAASSFSLQRAALSTLGVEGQGEVHLDGSGKTPSWQGKLHLQCPDLEATLRKAVGRSPDLPRPLRRWQVSGQFRGQPGSLSVTGMEARASLFALEGDASVAWKGARPAVRFDLVSPDFDLDAFMASAFPDDGGKGDSGPWDLRSMKNVDMDGVLHVQRLTVWKFRLSSLSIPLKLHDGRLRCADIRSNCYGAPLRASVDARFEKGLDLALDVKADGIDVERASNDRADAKAVGGRGSLELELRQRMTAGGQWLSSLNGLWKMSLVNGYVQDRGRDGRRRGTPTAIRRCSASGNIRSGVVRSSDFFYLGDDLQAQGGGWVHLVRKQLDCNLSVKVGSIPPFPVRVYGPLDNPRTSIGAGTAILRILGSIAGSVGDVIGGLFGGLGQILNR
ncbi:MAG: AsmA family protein [Desulfovibrio sp.]|uniref:AsmA family protein n=1 Tax=Desulfovibrio sp. TaxID=885 RepID=UPI0025C3F17F|nr:AsmA-like C-terminal region-containing protein [Desulfovibrio sp.]MCI7569813.1 AsmA family protein [Desulfovibrio sp.]